MDLKLRVLEGKNAGQEVAVGGKKFFIGRAEDCHLRPGSDLISRHHCAIMNEDGYIAIRDFGSKNGTYVNGERVSGERELQAGDRLKVGPLEFEVHIAHNLAGKKRPPVHDLKEAASRTAEDGSRSSLDLDDWLKDSPKADSPTETRQMRMTDTSEIDVRRTREGEIPTIADPPEPSRAVAPETSVPDNASSKTLSGKSEKKPVGKLPARPADNSKDSQSAAAAMLDKLRKRR